MVVKKTRLIIRWEREKEFSESIWEKDDDGTLYGFYALLLKLIDIMRILDEPKENKGE